MLKLFRARSLTYVGEHEDYKLYSAVVNCVIRIVYLCKKTKTGIAYALLFSTDTDINPLTLYRSQGAFSCEFVSRCQAVYGTL